MLKNSAVPFWLLNLFIRSFKMKPPWNGKYVSDPLGFFTSGVYCSKKHDINYYVMINTAFKTWKGRKVPPLVSTSYSYTRSASSNGTNTDFFVVWSSLVCDSCWWWYVLSLGRVRRSVRFAYHNLCFPAGLSESCFLMLKMHACVKFHFLRIICLSDINSLSLLSEKSRLLQNLRRPVPFRTSPVRSIDRISFHSTLAWQ